MMWITRTVFLYSTGWSNSMAIYTGDGGKDGKATKADYMAALEAAMDDDQYDNDPEAGELSEAERLAAHADSPQLRMDGRPKGSEAKRIRPLTVSQMRFTQGLVEGKTMIAAYREAYPAAQAADQVIKSAAFKLSRDPRVQAAMQEAWGETVEALAEDTVATKRYVLKQLLAHSKDAKQEGTKLKALELMGKAVGMFKGESEKVEEKVTPEQLKKELAGHLKLLDNVRPMTKAQVVNE
jgi:hypothetical protein